VLKKTVIFILFDNKKYFEKKFIIGNNKKNLKMINLIDKNFIQEKLFLR